MTDVDARDPRQDAPTLGSGFRSWELVTLQHPPHTEVPLNGVSVQELRDAGYYRSAGVPKGQRRDLRRTLPDGRGLHARVYRDRTTLHWDRVDPKSNLLGHLVRDTPALLPSLAGAVASMAVMAWRWRR